jgi:hypothetical protein
MSKSAMQTRCREQTGLQRASELSCAIKNSTCFYLHAAALAASAWRDNALLLSRFFLSFLPSSEVPLLKFDEEGNV